MECAVCNTRSSVGYCAACQTLLCEECAVTCYKCRKLLCPDHVQETRSHKQLCPECMEERKAQVAERRAAADEDEAPTSLDALQQGEATGEIREEALAASVREPPPPWKLSLYSAIVGVVLMLIVLAFPSLRSFGWPGGGLFPTPYVLMLIPLVAIVWGIVALRDKEHAMDVQKAYAGLALALIAVVLGVVAVRTDPERLAEQQRIAEQEKLRSATPEEMTQKRESILNKYKQ